MVMNRKFLLGVGIFYIFSFAVFSLQVIQYFSYSKIQKKKMEIYNLEKKIESVEQDLETTTKEKEKLEQENAEQIHILEVWEKEVYQIKNHS